MATGSSEGLGSLIFKVKWNGTEYEVKSLSGENTILHLKEAVASMTNVLPPRQKLIGFKSKGTPDDTSVLSTLKLKSVTKLMMMGSCEETIAAAGPSAEDLAAQANLYDEDDVSEEVSGAVHKQEMNLEKIRKRISQYEIKMINPLRDGCKLLVLDIDCTFFDHRSTAERATDLARPFLNEFLTAVYPLYNIAIWSATGMKWVQTKLEELGLLTNPAFKISFMLDELAMISVYIEDGGGLINTKPLGVIWGHLKQFSKKNTVLVDDLRRNFLMNPHNGIKIKAFKRAHQNKATDRELPKLAKYLLSIAESEDLSKVGHRNWDRE